MPFDYVDIGPGPYEEDCAQVGEPDYAERSRKECTAFKYQLLRMFPPPEGASVVVRSHQHDFGVYREVAVKFDSENEAAADYAYMLEGESPKFWDELAKGELK